LCFWCVPPVRLEEFLFDHTHRKLQGLLSGAPLGHGEVKPVWLHRLPLRVTQVLGERFFKPHPVEERHQIIETIWKVAAKPTCHEMDAEAFFEHLSNQVGKHGINKLSRSDVNRLRVWLFVDGDAEYWRL
jgi:hypothetical protein